MKRFLPNQKCRKDAGFTLLELLVVLAILALLAAIVGPRVMGVLGQAKSDVARTQMENIATSLDLLNLDMGRYPSAGEGLEALVRKPAGVQRWNGPYLNGKEVPLDPWGRAYIYEAGQGEGSAYRLRSLGADGQVGGEGDNADIVKP